MNCDGSWLPKGSEIPQEISGSAVLNVLDALAVLGTAQNACQYANFFHYNADNGVNPDTSVTFWGSQNAHQCGDFVHYMNCDGTFCPDGPEISQGVSGSAVLNVLAVLGTTQNACQYANFFHYISCNGINPHIGMRFG